VECDTLPTQHVVHPTVLPTEAQGEADAVETGIPRSIIAVSVGRCESRDGRCEKESPGSSRRAWARVTHRKGGPRIEWMKWQHCRYTGN
jgi:hypothetical protein